MLQLPGHRIRFEFRERAGIGTTTITYQLTSETLATNLAITVPTSNACWPVDYYGNRGSQRTGGRSPSGLHELVGRNYYLRSSAYVFTPSDLVTFTLDTTVPIYFFIFQVGSQQQSVQYTNSDVLRAVLRCPIDRLYVTGAPSCCSWSPMALKKAPRRRTSPISSKSEMNVSMSSELSGGSDSVYEVVPYPTDVTTITNEIPNDKRTDTQTLDWDTGSMRMTGCSRRGRGQSPIQPR